MKLTALVLLGAPLASEASAGCPCLPQPADPKQTSAEGKPAYVGQAAAYGWGCKAHDQGEDLCGNPDFNASMEDGGDNDWCEDKWCIVDPDNCDHNPRLVTYTAAENDYFSYEACDNGDFKGNGWIGRCKNCGPDHKVPSYQGKSYENSHCKCGGFDGCKCLSTYKKQAPATDKPAYVGTVPTYGYGCKAHDKGYDACNGTDTSDGSKHDWCADKWCIVDKDNCYYVAREVTYSAALDDYFSYETCDLENFKGNSWVGTCPCSGNTESHCDGSAGYECHIEKASGGACSSGLAGVVAVLAALGILQ